jgi:general secretion pathway protein J
MIREHGPSAGFTLIEALVATALMGVILGALATLTAQWLPGWNRGAVRVERAEQAAIALDRLVADLAAAEYVTPNRLVKAPLFEGSEFGVTFVRSGFGPNVRGGLEIIRIAELVDSKGRALVRLRAPFAPLAIDNPALDAIAFADPVVLLRDPLRVHFSYAGRDGEWTSVWTNSGELPGAVLFLIRNVALNRTLAISTATRVHADMPAPEPEQVKRGSTTVGTQLQTGGRT